MQVFLDLDGTLTDPKPGITKSFAYALESIGLTPPPLDQLTWVIGPALIDSFRKLEVDDPAKALELYRERYSDKGLFENRVYTGIPEALDQMNKAGLVLNLATAKPHIYARQITAHFDLSKFLENEFGPELDGTRNNKGELLEYALKKIGSDAENSVMVGDRIVDFEAARHVGMRSIGVTWGYGPSDETEQADFMCHEPKDLPTIVLQAIRLPV